MVVVSFRFPKSYFQHAILLVQDSTVVSLSEADPPSSYEVLNYNISVYIGDDASYENNQECPGGPFLPFNDNSSLIDVPSAGISSNKGGFEAWCNLEGQYTHIVFDYSQD